MNDFWVDEIWSLELGVSAPTWASVFWGISHAPPSHAMFLKMFQKLS